MQIYSSQDINKIKEENKYNISRDIIEILDYFTNLVSSPNYIKSPNFINKKSIILNSDRNNIEVLNDNINKILNKITNKNYDKLIIELISIIETIIFENNNKIDNTADIIFERFFISDINIELNIKILYCIINKFNCFHKYLDNFINSIKDLHTNIKICNIVTFEELDKVNKNNNIIKNKIKFYSQLGRLNKIDNNDVNINIIYYQNLLNNKLEKCLSKIECEEIAELVFTFLNEKTYLDLKNIHENKIYTNIKIIAESTIEKNKNLTNKIILKHKNILDKLNLL